MPHQQQEHRHLHRRRALPDGVDRWVGGMNPLESRDVGDGGDGAVNSQRDVDATRRATLVRTVYKTMEPTFKGPIAGYSTLLGDGSPPPSQAPEQDPPPAPTSTPEPLTTSSMQQTPDATMNLSTLPTAITVSTSGASIGSVLILATDKPSASPTPALGNMQPSSLPSSSTPTSTLPLPSASSIMGLSTTSNDANEGSSAGQKAGIAFGAVGAALLVGLFVFLLFSRRKRTVADGEKLHDDERLTGAGGAGAAPPLAPAVLAPRTNPTAPRISLRPVTQFLPNWNGLDRRTSKGAAVALAAAGAGAGAAAAPRPVGGSVWERPPTSQSANPANPFGSQAERAHSSYEAPSMRSASTPASPSIDGERSPVAESTASSSSTARDVPTANGPPMAAAGAAAAAAGLVRKTSMRNGGPKNVDLTLPQPSFNVAPPSPAGTEFSMSSVAPGAPPPPSNGAAAIAAAGGPKNSGVYRVQLDFQPTLDDEMGLTAGELVRLLHEYDDGWALVIRLDRSRQGVVPRTCLSTRPVKPRPPLGGARPGPPVSPMDGPRGGSVGNGLRPMTPQGVPLAGRPGRPQSPGLRSQGAPDRPQSPGGMMRRMSPPGPSPMRPQAPPPGETTGPGGKPVGRKPVPGQAY